MRSLGHDFPWPLVVTTGQRMQPNQVGLAMFHGQYGIFCTVLMAATVLEMFAAFLVFLVALRHFIEGVAGVAVAVVRDHVDAGLRRS